MNFRYFITVNSIFKPTNLVGLWKYEISYTACETIPSMPYRDIIWCSQRDGTSFEGEVDGWLPFSIRKELFMPSNELKYFVTGILTPDISKYVYLLEGTLEPFSFSQINWKPTRFVGTKSFDINNTACLPSKWSSRRFNFQFSITTGGLCLNLTWPEEPGQQHEGTTT